MDHVSARPSPAPAPGQLEQTIVSAAPDGVLLVDRQGTILMANPALEQLSGHDAAQLVGESIRVFLPPWLRDKHDGLVNTFFQRPSQRPMGMVGNLQLLRRDGRSVPVDISLGATVLHGEPVAVVFLRDMTEMRRLQEQMQYQAAHDALTGLVNRWMFGQHMGHALARAQRQQQPLGLLLLDLDDFKAVNDGHGHAAGDQVLVEVARRFKGALRAGDILGRQGGDEFTVLLPDIADAEDARRVADKLLAALDAPVRLNGYEVTVGASIGLACYPEDATDAETLMRFADMAMYCAKDAGRGTQRTYRPQIGHALEEKALLHERLRLALERDALHLHYQPQVDVASGRVEGVEALLRWTDPELGELPPARFIPVAAKTGLMPRLGDWVLRAACRQAARWHRAGRSVRVSVNLSAQQFRQPDLVDRLLATLALFDTPASLIELEITESEAMADPDQAREQLHRLRELGVTVALDDFGTGYCSLAYLRDLPIARLKLDREFMRRVAEREGDATLARAIVALAHTLGLPVVAEGVETEAQLEFLRREGCDTYQGWLFARALPAAEVEALLPRY